MLTSDRYRHSYQLEIEVRAYCDDTILESGENIASIALGRKEVAHIILTRPARVPISYPR
jgi:hypothetical protein